MDSESGKYGRRRRKQIAADLENHIQGADPKDTQAQLEKLKAGLSLVLEQAKVDMAATSEADRTRVGLFKAVTPLLVTAGLSGLGSFVTLTYQSRQHARDAQSQQEQAKTASDRQGQELQATEQTNARKERTDLLERLAQSIAAGPAPAASCWYVEGIWNDYAPGDPLPEVLAVRCRGADAGAGGLPPAAPWGQWVVVADTDRTREAGCLAAVRARLDNLDLVQLLFDKNTNLYVTTAGEFTVRTDAVGYLQRVRAVRPSAYIARQSCPNWNWVDCTPGASADAGCK
ncbi:MAG TPA: hypothetical protein VEK07_23610 [Polyangiaceae bacterium]|nr:hypothetical protein [Polyangiaceae bacterium]